MTLLVFKTSVGLNKVSGGFDSHPPPPISAAPRTQPGWALNVECSSLSFVNVMIRVSQPPIDPIVRSSEHHEFWPGLILTLVAGALILCGAFHRTRLETTDGNSAREFQLIKAFARGGLEVLPAVNVPVAGAISFPV